MQFRSITAVRGMIRTVIFLTLLVPLAACGNDDLDTGSDAGSADAHAGPAALVTPEQVIEQYASIVHASYTDSLNQAIQLQAAIETLIAAPSAARLEAAKRAWLEARQVYGQTEAYRFYDGPIDDPESGPEGRINPWPMDEAYVDYVLDPQSTPDAPVYLHGGIVNTTDIEITKASLAALNEGGMGDVLGVGDSFDPGKAVSTGYHAIELLLWGQDFDPSGPGSRPYQDYLTGADATAPNGDRRGQYLQTAAALLIDDLTTLVSAWAPDAAGNYRDGFVNGAPAEALRAMLSGIGVLSKGELASERMDVALRSLDQEDEHSCFSDNTHIDILMNATGIQNVYLGRYGYLEGPSISDLAYQIDPDLDLQMRAQMAASIQAVLAIPVPFDQAIPVQGSASWNQVEAAVSALFAQSDTIIAVGEALGLGNVSVSLPE